jgi:hypothetical protein
MIYVSIFLLLLLFDFEHFSCLLFTLYIMFRVDFFLPNVTKLTSWLGGSLVTTAWRVLRLRMEETASRYAG